MHAGLLQLAQQHVHCSAAGGIWSYDDNGGQCWQTRKRKSWQLSLSKNNSQACANVLGACMACFFGSFTEHVHSAVWYSSNSLMLCKELFNKMYAFSCTCRHETLSSVYYMLTIQAAVTHIFSTFLSTRSHTKHIPTSLRLEDLWKRAFWIKRACARTCTRTHTRTHACTHACTYVHTHTHTHTHIHTHTTQHMTHNTHNTYMCTQTHTCAHNHTQV